MGGRACGDPADFVVQAVPLGLELLFGLDVFMGQVADLPFIHRMVVFGRGLNHDPGPVDHFPGRLRGKDRRRNPAKLDPALEPGNAQMFDLLFGKDLGFDGQAVDLGFQDQGVLVIGQVQPAQQLWLGYSLAPSGACMKSRSTQLCSKGLSFHWVGAIGAAAMMVLVYPRCAAFLPVTVRHRNRD